MGNIPLDDKKIIILYIEDEEVLLKSTLKHLKKVYSSDCIGVRSLQEAQSLLKRSKIIPHLALLDCQPLRREKDDRHSESAGDELYALLVQKNIPVIVLSGLAEEVVLSKSAYQSHRPLKCLSKPLVNQELDDTINEYLDKVR